MTTPRSLSMAYSLDLEAARFADHRIFRGFRKFIKPNTPEYQEWLRLYDQRLEQLRRSSFVRAA